MGNDTAINGNAAASGRIRPDDHAWEQFFDPHGRPTTPVRILKFDDPYLLEADFPPNYYAGLHWHPHDTIYIFTKGEMRIGSEGSFRPGDVRWVRGGHPYGPEEATEDGVVFYLLSLGGDIGLNWADLYDVPADIGARRDSFDSVWGRMTFDDARLGPLASLGAPAGVGCEALSHSHPFIWRLRLAAGATLPAHASPSDTLMLVRAGAVRAAGEGDYPAPEMRWSKAGAPTPAMTAGPDGAELLLLGLNGPIDLQPL